MQASVMHWPQTSTSVMHWSQTSANAMLASVMHWSQTSANAIEAFARHRNQLSTNAKHFDLKTLRRRHAMLIRPSVESEGVDHAMEHHVKEHLHELLHAPTTQSFFLPPQSRSSFASLRHSKSNGMRNGWTLAIRVCEHRHDEKKSCHELSSSRTRMLKHVKCSLAKWEEVGYSRASQELGPFGPLSSTPHLSQTSTLLLEMSLQDSRWAQHIVRSKCSNSCRELHSPESWKRASTDGICVGCVRD